MNLKTILKIQGFLLIILAGMMIFPLIFSFYYQSDDWSCLLISIGITLFAGLLLSISFKAESNIRTREGFIIVSLGWIFASLFGALPFFLYGSFGNYINCVFEAMSGFTTTGATILTNIEGQPKGLLFWRSMTHWLGGMGIILLTIAVLPIFGLTSGQLFNAEVPGPTKDRISPKIKDTAKILWMIYGGMTIIETALLMLGGMTLYDALCHTFGTLATGGFSTLNASVAGFNNLYIEIVIIFFMYLAGINFALHFQLINGNLKSFLTNREWIFYTSVLVVSILAIAFNVYFAEYTPEQLKLDKNLVDYSENFGAALRVAAFQVVSITTTTGFCTANFDLWPSFSKILLILLMFLGGSSGSTGGGMKQIRIIIILKKVANEIKQLAHPKAVLAVKVGKEHIPDFVIKNVLAFFVLFVGFFAIITLFLCFMGYDIITSFSASIATLGNIGPGLAQVGAIENYAFFDPLSKIVLTFAMLLGRLEIYSILILIYALLLRRKSFF
ncbi:MAG: TrkH family potassium uptake protein [Spirochaetes bacterium]|nr:TrkH family potassium uptake protein [Spirochaetota bacterium]